MRHEELETLASPRGEYAMFDRCLRIQVRVTKYAAKIGGTTATLKEGDVLTLRQLMHGMMLPSGNDAAYQIAEFFGQVLKERKYGGSGVVAGCDDGDMVPGPRGIPVTS